MLNPRITIRKQDTRPIKLSGGHMNHSLGIASPLQAAISDTPNVRRRDFMSLSYRVIVWLSILFVLQLLVGCSTPEVISSSPLPIVPPYPLEYRIQPGDQMEIKFYYTPDLNEVVTVRPDGRISLQLVHDMQAAGLTPTELSNTLVRSYARELKHPEISVIMRTFEGQRIYVDGEVNKPGIVPLASNMTIFQSIAIAGGVKDTANRGEIILIRRGREGKPEPFYLNLKRVLEGTDPSHDILLKSFDIVYVPKSEIAKINLWVNQYIRGIMPIEFGLGYNLGY